MRDLIFGSSLTETPYVYLTPEKELIVKVLTNHLMEEMMGYCVAEENVLSDCRGYRLPSLCLLPSSGEFLIFSIIIMMINPAQLTYINADKCIPKFYNTIAYSRNMGTIFKSPSISNKINL